MLYASSKDAIRRSLVGIANEIQGTDYSEIAYTESKHPSSQLDATHTVWRLTEYIFVRFAVLDKVSRGTA